jgi:type I restriction enzyme M protein
MANERNTEDIVRDHFKNDPLYKVIILEEQNSKSQRVRNLLKTASKSGKSKKGMPEFIITFPSQNINYIVVVECKAAVDKHESANKNKPKEYAVDGALHYAKVLSKDYNVIALAISGETARELKVSTFLWTKESPREQNLNEDKLLQISDYIKVFKNEHFSENLINIDILQKAVYLNEEFNSYAITENGRCTIVSAILLSLLDEPFKSSYATYTKTYSLAEGMIEALKRVLNSKPIRNKESMIKEFNKILNEPIFKLDVIRKDDSYRDTLQVVKEDFIDYIYKNIYPLIKLDDAGFDILGKFYTEFIRYAGSSQKQGLVLTPKHVTEFFCDLANVSVDSIVYDPCCGSGGFLIAAMKRMITLAGANSDKKKDITTNQLVGVERRPDMFSYACTNMMFRGDGKSNIYNNDCFNLESQIIKSHHPNISFLNPPYDVGPAGQMEFIEHALNVVSATNGIVVAIVQMSCAIKNENNLIAIKERLLKRHRLKAVISMPDKLFTGVVTCIMVWESNIPNAGYQTWFGYLRDDGFEIRRHRGRLDFNNRWESIRENFIREYKNSNVVADLSIKHEIKARDEWCVEAYMETDYSKLTKDDFLRTLKNYVGFNFMNSN